MVNSGVTAAISCSNPKEECIEPGGTRYFDGAPVTLDCWKYKTTYECKAEADNNCKQLIAEGCSPSSTVCKVKWGDTCAVREVTYDCPVRKCDGTEIICNDKGGFCLTGNCVLQERSKDPHMQQALSALSSVAEAVKDFRDNPKIFKGKPMECSKNILGAKNCCGINPRGWAEGVFLECADDERELAAKKASGLATLIGEYCYNEVAGVCTSYHDTYCIFGSKLGRILRVAARDQLGLGFGSPENPICNGLTIEQFQQLNLVQIDFSEFYQDIQNKQRQQSAASVNSMMQQRAESLKTKLQGNAQKTINRANELRIRK